MNELAKNVSIRLKIARVASGFHSAKEFIEKHSIPASTYSQHENGKRALSLENITHYADLTNVDAAWLVTGRGNPCGEKFNQSGLEEKILAEQERLENMGELDVSAIPLVSIEKKFSSVNIHVFRKILNILLPLLKDVPDPKVEDIVDFCFDLYNKIIATNANDFEREKLIKIGFDSFFKGLNIRIKDEVLRNIAAI